ncbi:O-antigen ligase family protein [Thermogemmatispora sp.]|uniref:O-antigen ligase family protein n=1 Tax=Thermogemmatispora sp. TaxID=1968838 RepID=UPI002ACC24FF|nr:O-antigen ligase family protein [Thermogemmatispora sp.]
MSSLPESPPQSRRRYRAYPDELATPPPAKGILPLWIALMLGLALLPLLILAGVSIGFSIVVALLTTFAASLLIMRWPVCGLFLCLACVLLVEQNPLQIHIGTDQLNIFYWPPNMAGMIERPIGFLMLFTLFMAICHRLAKRYPLLEGGPLIWPFLAFLICVAIGVIHGLATGGDLKITVLEVRPLWYLFLAYLLAYNLISQLRHVRLFFWFAIFGAAFKGLQGCYIYFFVLHGDLTNQNEIMSHEESFFFVSILLIIILFCMLYRYRPQLYAALAVLPPVLIALIANKRRADYIALIVGVAVAWAFVFYLKPHLRKPLLAGLVICSSLGIGYVLAFAHGTGSLAEPARAIVSVIDPSASDARDQASNAYRNAENYDLKYTVQQNPLLGLGFGKQFLQPEPLPVLANDDPDFGGNPYLYVPHNTIYWIWMRLGPAGYIAFWFLLGALIVRGGLITRRLQEPYLRLVAVYVIAITCMEVMVAYADYQLFFYRNVIYLGLLAGLLMRLPALEKPPQQIAPARILSSSQPRPALSEVSII